MTIFQLEYKEAAMDLGFKGKTALVTGAGSPVGFGKAIALLLAKEGCDAIAVNDINLEDARKTAEEVKALGCKSIAVKADVTSRADVREMVAKVLAEFGHIDILVNNAGGMYPQGPFLEQEEKNWDKEFNLSIKGPMFCCQAVLPGMMERRYGKIINISSSVVKMAFPGVSTYSMAKSAVILFTRGLALDVIKKGITVNSVAPGWALTRFSKMPPEELEKRFLPHTPVGRGTTPQDIANTVVFLASDISADIVGQVICVDGGSTMQ
jgi:NAD(P)-dependent dehydrogenase (short-subunit alcohol dehydrogenase family)